MNPAEYCRDRLRREATSAYYSTLFLDPERRPALRALLALSCELASVIYRGKEPAVVRMKLHWWREEIERSFRHAARHPAARALQEPLRHYNLPREYFHEILDGWQMPADHPQFGTFNDLALFCRRVSGTFEQLASEICGFGDRGTTRYAHNLGMGLQMIRIVRNARQDAACGRVMIPADELRQFGVTHPDLQSCRAPENMTDLFRYQLRRAVGYLDRALDSLPERDRYAQRYGLTMAAISRAVAQEIEADGYRVTEHRVVLTPLRKLWIAWRTARREKRRCSRENRSDV